MPDDNMRLQEFAEKMAKLAAEYPTAHVAVEIPSAEAVRHFYRDCDPDEFLSTPLIDYEVETWPLSRKIVLKTNLS